jgi:hypothetical protein
VLISPYAFVDFHAADDCLFVNLTRQQIENSPPIESHKPVSRQYEEEYHRLKNENDCRTYEEETPGKSGARWLVSRHRSPIVLVLDL